MSSKLQISRRNFLEQTGLAACGIALAGCSGHSAPEPKAGAGDAQTITVGYISPESGLLRELGEANDYIIGRIMAALDGKSIMVDGKPVRFVIERADTQSSPERASELARAFIESGSVDLIAAQGAPETVSPVAAVCDAAGMPAVTSLAPITSGIATVAPTGSYISGGSFSPTFHFFFSLDDLVDLFIGLWSSVKTNRVVGAVWPDDADGHTWRPVFSQRLIDAGFKLVDPGPFSPTASDFTDVIDAWKRGGVEILGGVCAPPTLINLWTQAYNTRFRPKLAIIGKALLFPSTLNTLGAIGEGLATEVFWSPAHPFASSLDGTTCAQLAEGYQQQWIQPLGMLYALFEVIIDAFRRAGSRDRAAIGQALTATKLDTMIGRVAFDDRNVSHAPVVVGQWVKGTKHPFELEIVSNTNAPEIPITRPFRLM